MKEGNIDDPLDLVLPESNEVFQKKKGRKRGRKGGKDGGKEKERKEPWWVMGGMLKNKRDKGTNRKSSQKPSLRQFENI